MWSGQLSKASELPNYIPKTDLFIAPEAKKAEFLPCAVQNDVLQPEHWAVEHIYGPKPFITHIKWRCGANSQVFPTWASRLFRKQLEQTIMHGNGDQSAGERTNSPTKNSNWHRALSLWIDRWAWWAVLFYNVGSHSFIYAGICLFIPFFNKDETNYKYNTGWTSLVLSGLSWLLAVACDIISLCLTSRTLPIYWSPPTKLCIKKTFPFLFVKYTHKFSKIKEHEITVQPARNASATASNNNNNNTNNSNDGSADNLRNNDPDDPFAGWSSFRFDWLVLIPRVIGILLLTGWAFTWSGDFVLPAPTMLPLLLTVGSIFLLIGAYFNIVEHVASWNPCRIRGPFPSNTKNSLLLIMHWAYFSGCALFLAYSIVLLVAAHISNYDMLLDQSKFGAAYPFLIASLLFTVADWIQFIEQGKQFKWQPANPQQPGRGKEDRKGSNATTVNSNNSREGES
jgi:hypothetical protein